MDSGENSQSTPQKQKVYRAVRKGEIEVTDKDAYVSPKNPSSPISPNAHVAGGSHISGSRFISGTHSSNVALSFATDGNGILVSDLTKNMDRLVLDFDSTNLPPLSLSALRFGSANSELVFEKKLKGEYLLKPKYGDELLQKIGRSHSADFFTKTSGLGPNERGRLVFDATIEDFRGHQLPDASSQSLRDDLKADVIKEFGGPLRLWITSTHYHSCYCNVVRKALEEDKEMASVGYNEHKKITNRRPKARECKRCQHSKAKQSLEDTLPARFGALSL